LAEKLKYLGVKEETYNKIGEWLSNTFVNDILVWIHSKKKRKVKIKLHKYDTWNMESTLALIVLPMLKQLHETKHGSPFVFDDDVPDPLKSTNCAPKENEWDTDENFFRRWEWVMDEMIWTFEQLQPDNAWEGQYHHGKIDFEFVKKEGTEYSEMLKTTKDTHWFDSEGAKKHQDRIDNGLRLFGKYYNSLWD
jgi:hypothetical protein